MRNREPLPIRLWAGRKKLILEATSSKGAKHDFVTLRYETKSVLQRPDTEYCFRMDLPLTFVEDALAGMNDSLMAIHSDNGSGPLIAPGVESLSLIDIKDDVVRVDFEAEPFLSAIEFVLEALIANKRDLEERPTLLHLSLRVAGTRARFGVADGFHLAQQTLTIWDRDVRNQDRNLDLMIPIKAQRDFIYAAGAHRVRTKLESVRITYNDTRGSILLAASEASEARWPFPIHQPKVSVLVQNYDGTYPAYESLITTNEFLGELDIEELRKIVADRWQRLQPGERRLGFGTEGRTDDPLRPR